MNPKYLMDTFGIEPKKSLGQNFLHDPNTLEKIVATADIQPGDNVVEIGPGTGALTVYLAQSGANVLAVEIDDRLTPILERQLSDFANVDLIHGDFLDLDLSTLFPDEEYIIVANLPYYITSAILQHIFESTHKPKRLVLTVQQEVAERITATPGDLSLLAISIQFYGTPKLAARLNPAVFWPRPDVSSAILRIDVYDQPPVNVPNSDAFFKVVKAGFGQKRKQLRNSLSAGLGISHTNAGALLEAAGIDPSRRAETLTLPEWASITRVHVTGIPPQDFSSDMIPNQVPSHVVAHYFTSAYRTARFGTLPRSPKSPKVAQENLGKVTKKNL